MSHDEEIPVFLLECPMSGETGRDGWFESIEEYLHGDLDLKMSTERENEGFPESTLSSWEASLKSGETWRKWVAAVDDNGLDLQTCEDLKPLKLLFAETALEVLANAKS